MADVDYISIKVKLDDIYKKYTQVVERNVRLRMAGTAVAKVLSYDDTPESDHLVHLLVAAIENEGVTLEEAKDIAQGYIID